jgi:hypothetical protein
MSNFHFLKKDLEWKIVKTQWLGPTYPTSHISHSPQRTPYHLLYRSIPLHPDIVREAHSSPSAFLFALVRLSSILVQERKYPFLCTQEMSDKSRYEWRLYLHPLHTHFAFLDATIFSLEQLLKRENYTPVYHYTPFRATPEMSDKLRYEWQIILRYYLYIIYELSIERSTTTTC